MTEEERDIEKIQLEYVGEDFLTTFTCDDFGADKLVSLKKSIEENKKLIDKNFARDNKNFKKLKTHEVEDIVNFQVRLEKIHEELKDDFTRVVEKMEEFHVKMNTFEGNMEDMKKVEDHIKRLDLKQLRREIEILKTKEHWIMDNLEKLDIDPVFEKIQEIEHNIKLLKATSPFVIE